MYALLFFFCLTGQSGPSACGHVANNNNNNNNNICMQSKHPVLILCRTMDMGPSDTAIDTGTTDSRIVLHKPSTRM